MICREKVANNRSIAVALSKPGSDPPVAFGTMRLHLHSASRTECALRQLSDSAAI